MATPRVIDGKTNLSAAVLTTFVNPVSNNNHCRHARLLFTSGANTVTLVSGASVAGITSADCSWNGGSTRIEIVVSGFTSSPIAWVNIVTGLFSASNAEHVRIGAASSTRVDVEFFGSGGSTTSVTPDDDVQIDVMIIGF